MRGRTALLAIVAAAGLTRAASAAEELGFWGRATFDFRGRSFAGDSADDNVTGYFDQYFFTANKSGGFPVELGLRELFADWLGRDDTPLGQLRFRSPTSNLSLLGVESEEVFLNQRAELHLRPDGLRFDTDYWRFRTDQLRKFTDPSGVAAFCVPCFFASQFSDDTDPDDRFFSRRTGFYSNVRFRPRNFVGGEARIITQVSVRGGYESREGKRQLKTLLSDDDFGASFSFRPWRGLTRLFDQRDGKVGGGLVFGGGRRVTLALDFDHDRFRDGQSTFTQEELAARNPGELFNLTPPVNLRTFGFVPDSNRYTATARLHGFVGERTRWHAGGQGALLEQGGTRTPLQTLHGLKRNRVYLASGNLVLDTRWNGSVATNLSFWIDYRDNDIDRNSGLFNSNNQITAFLHRVVTARGVVEVIRRFRGSDRVTLGFRGHWVDRDLDFATPLPGGQAILERNAVLHDNTARYTGFLSARLQPIRGLQLRGEVGGTAAPDTGYVTDYSKGVYGESRIAYTLPAARPLVAGVWGRVEYGKNDDFAVVGETAGKRNRDFEQLRYRYGVTLSAVPWDGVSGFLSFTHQHDDQEFDLIRATARRFLEPDPATDVDFFVDTPLDYRSDMKSVIVGVSADLTEDTELSLAYSFTTVHGEFRVNSATAATISPASAVDGDIHGVEAEIGHWIRDGLRIFAGYRYDEFIDNGRPRGSGNAVEPLDLSAGHHSVHWGVTLTSGIFD